MVNVKQTIRHNIRKQNLFDFCFVYFLCNASANRNAGKKKRKCLTKNTLKDSGAVDGEERLCAITNN